MYSTSMFTDPVVSCPYDKFHRIALSKIQMHIVKCEKNYPAGYLETCPYNATHRFPKHELQDHIQSCPQKRLIDPESYQYVENHGSLMSDFIAESLAESNIDHGESWDEEFQKNSEPTGDDSLNYSTASSSLRRIDNPRVNLRRPKGYSEVMMIGGESDAAISDMESVVSVMGIGRGRINPNNIHLYKRLNFGRGRSLPSDKRE